MIGDAAKLNARVLGDKYRLDTMLGEGAFGAVYRARHLSLGKDVAVKVMHRFMSEQPEAARRFKAEARAASQLEHPHSIQVFDFGEEADGLLYLVMELVDGRDLQAVLHDHGRLDPSQTQDILFQVARVLAKAHGLGIIHRDLKPGNIMMVSAPDEMGDTRDVAKVCDFGLAKMLEGSFDETASGPVTQQGAVFGTPSYMAPEQAKGHPTDARADVYAFGVLMFRMFSGRLPFESETPIGMLMKHIMDDPPDLQALVPDLDPQVCALVHRCLEKDAEDRPASMVEVLREISGLFDVGVRLPSGITSRPPSGPTGPTGQMGTGAGALGSVPPAERFASTGGTALVTPVASEIGLASGPGEPTQVVSTAGTAAQSSRVWNGLAFLGAAAAVMLVIAGVRVFQSNGEPERGVEVIGLAAKEPSGARRTAEEPGTPPEPARPGSDPAGEAAASTGSTDASGPSSDGEGASGSPAKRPGGSDLAAPPAERTQAAPTPQVRPTPVSQGRGRKSDAPRARVRPAHGPASRTPIPGHAPSSPSPPSPSVSGLETETSPRGTDDAPEPKTEPAPEPRSEPDSREGGSDSAPADDGRLRPGYRFEVRLGPLKAMGGMSTRRLQQGLERQLPELRKCLFKEIDQTGRTTRGQLQVRGRISFSGRLQELKTDGALQTGSSCVTRSFRAARMPRPDTGEALLDFTVEYAATNP